MKSLLVDALRQLEEGKAPADAPAPKADAVVAPDELELTAGDATPLPAESPAPADDPVEIDTGELVLESDHPPGTALDDHSFDGHAFDELGSDDPASDDAHPLVATMTLDVASGDLASTAIIETPAASNNSAAGHPKAISRDTPRLQRIAILTPVFCLLLGAASAAGYFAYSYVGALNLNADLGALPAYVGDGGEVDMPTADDTAFILAVNAPPPAPRQPAATAAPVAASAASAPATTPRVPRQAASPTAEDLAYPVLEKAYAAWRSGDIVGAERHYREALDIAPRHPNALSGLAAVLQASGRAGEAKPVYARLLAMEPDNATAVAALLDDGANGQASIDEIHALIEHHPDSAPLYFALGSAHARQSHWIEARVAFADAFERAPARADYAFNLAVSLDRIGRYGEAESLYNRALELADDRRAVDRAVVVARLNELSAVNAGSRP